MTSTIKFDKWENTANTKSVTMDQIAGGSGLVPVLPTSIGVQTGSASVGANGVVSFSGATAVELNNCFSSEYRNYKFIVNVSVSNSPSWYRYRANGANLTTSDYFDVGIQAYYDGAPATISSRSQNIGYPLYLVGTQCLWTGEISSPYVSAPTRMISEGTRDNSGFFRTAQSVYNVNTIADGISFIFENVATGTVQVYGYR